MEESIWAWIGCGWLGVLTVLALVILIKAEIDFNDHNRHH